ncbi:conserved hypothetical protein [Methylocella silvestris BL2]|uniref:Uncharacterized protein n=1 Tax=Methylocella silvestris (strain DSM 15510 / CIP 108128 / LMG 27833 / NCIMB 13906 / BL2) TaxID=395965 RepID=B8EM43_METSB|nr:hypothetical protein [Methylocella silvestris]ACK51432.1 conserved hypothetical protein [Methylocella silvestris BL2]
MRNASIALASSSLLALAAFLPAGAAPIAPIGQILGDGGSARLLPVAQGCGPGAWRGPWGHCRNTPYYGPLPGGGYAYYGNGCPPGWWRGPWGHCRNTPFHGRLPNGFYQ